MNNVEIGSICIAGDVILVSWYDRNTRASGVDIVDWDNKLDGAYLETKLLPVYRRAFANYTAYIVDYCEIPAGTSIEMYYSTDYGETFTQLSMVDDTQRLIMIGTLSVEATQIMVKIVARTSGNDGPSFNSAGVQIT